MLRLSLAISILLLSLSSTVHAGKMSTNADGPGKYQLEDIAFFAKMVEKSLASKGARVAIVSRVGQSSDSLPKGVYFTHVAFWVRVPPSNHLAYGSCQSRVVSHSVSQCTSSLA